MLTLSYKRTRREMYGIDAVVSKIKLPNIWRLVRLDAESQGVATQSGATARCHVGLSDRRWRCDLPGAAEGARAGLALRAQFSSALSHFSRLHYRAWFCTLSTSLSEIRNQRLSHPCFTSTAHRLAVVE
jgi:hypothetical protein